MKVINDSLKKSHLYQWLPSVANTEAFDHVRERESDIYVGIKMMSVS